MDLPADRSIRDLVSILICSKERRGELEKLVFQLANLDLMRPVEVVVVEETDTPKALAGVQYVPHPSGDKGFPYARNLALDKAQGSVVVFLDDDCRVQANWLDNLLAPFADDSLVAVQGGVSVPKSTNAIGWAETILGFPGGGLRRVVDADGQSSRTKEVSTLNCAYRKSIIDRIGGFDSKLSFGGEDYLLAKQACAYGHCLFVPSARVTHEARGTIPKIWQWFVRRGRAEISVIRTGKQSEMSGWTLIRGSLSIKLLLVTMASFAFHSVLPSVVLFTIAYLLIQYGRNFRVWKASGSPIKALLVIPLVKLVMDLGIDWGRIHGAVVR